MQRAIAFIGAICFISVVRADADNSNVERPKSQQNQTQSLFQAATSFEIEPLPREEHQTTLIIEKTGPQEPAKRLTRFQRNKLARKLAREKRKKEKQEKINENKRRKFNKRQFLPLSDPRVAPTEENNDCAAGKCRPNNKNIVKKQKKEETLLESPVRKYDELKSVEKSNKDPASLSNIPENIFKGIEDTKATSLNHFSRQENERNMKLILQNSNCYNQPADIMFVIDTSYDMDNKDFQNILNFTIRTVDSLPISSTETQVGIATFDVFVDTKINFKEYHEKNLLTDAISRIEPNEEQSQELDRDNFGAILKLFSSDNGARQIFSGTEHVMVMITNDGSMMSDRISNVLSQDGVEKYLIVVGEGIQAQEIQHLVSEPAMSHAYVIADFDGFEDIEVGLRKQICNEEICSNGNIIGGGITGFDLLALMNVDENKDIIKLNGSLEDEIAYTVGHHVDLRLNPASLILPLGLPRYYSMVATLQMNEHAIYHNWTIFELRNTRGEVVEALKISGKNRSVEYVTMDGEAQKFSVIFTGAHKLFGEDFHKLTLVVDPEGTALYIDCNLVEKIPFTTPLGRSHTDGEIIIVDIDASEENVSVDFQQLDLICDTDIGTSDRFSCKKREQMKDIPSTKVLLEVETSQKHHTSSETLIRGRFNTPDLTGEFQQSENQTFRRQSHSTFKLSRTGGSGNEGNKNNQTEHTVDFTQSSQANGSIQNNVRVTQEELTDGPGKITDNDYYQKPFIPPPPGALTDDNKTYCECPPPEYITGPRGDIGEPGRDGPAGERGEQGEKGERGIKGSPGKDGRKGEMGPPGPQGQDGIAGRMGPIGMKGKKGIKGQRGPKGHLGVRGPDGVIGQKGAKGEPCNADLARLVDSAKGSKGEKGSRGLPGLPGLIGDAGTPSYRVGMKGHRGDPGHRGPKGSDGPRGMQGYNGPEGKKGPMGPRGEPGLPGIDGEKGEPGRTGPKGPMGDAGKPGPKGHRGRQGYPGNPGFPGLPGLKGHRGDAGERGQQGEVGKQGPPGQSGPKGEDGKIGEPGPAGPQGPQGIRGLQGSKGEMGPIGQPGDVGKQGEKGDKGEKGEDGFPGEIGPPRAMDEIIEAIKDVVSEMLPKYMTTLQKECQRCQLKRAFPGTAGAPGPAGRNGEQGLMGRPGKDGAIGRPGMQGPEGARGQPGPKGDKGDAGARGFDIAGQMGPPGQQGPPGKKGEGIAGIPGSPGPRGDMGRRGPVGRQGPAGAAGSCDASDCAGAPEFVPDPLVDSPYSKGPAPDNLRGPGESLSSGRLGIDRNVVVRLKGPNAPDRYNIRIGRIENEGRPTRRSAGRGG